MSIDTDILSAVAPSNRYTDAGYRWEQRRRELLGWQRYDRAFVADQLGVSQRTIERYETGETPDWYDLALVGLAVKLGTLKIGKAVKRKA
ncbi:MAG TPA: helix-turn-helix transcriptional regulator [Thermoanaerobaculia bacterium]